MTPKPTKEIERHKGTLYDALTGRIRQSVCLQPGLAAKDHYTPGEGEAFIEGLYVENPDSMIIKDGEPVKKPEDEQNGS